MTKNLVIVESPAKAKTIEGFLGKEFTVRSCYGHIRDLSKTDLGINVEKGFIPDYIIPEDKVKIVNELKKLAEKASVVWLATDEDREGEAISWHLSETLKLKPEQTKRIVFHEITKNAITEAVEHPRTVNLNLVNAQQARRVLDRLVGYELSPLLWKKVKPSLSAGRVQSVAVRLIVERENEINNFNVVSYFKVTAVFSVEKDGTQYKIKAEISEKFNKKEDAEDFLKKCINAAFKVKDVETKPAKKSPAPPFTTSTLQQEASRKLGFSVAKTMMIAQQLYEEGKITYMRTDSVNLSKLALSMAKSEIEKEFGNEYLKTRNFTTKTRGAQEAHEAIRPTYFNKHQTEGSNDQKKLYELIWKRTIASQMSDALIEKTIITIHSPSVSKDFIAGGEVIKFDGFLKLYIESTDDEQDENNKTLLPPLKVNDTLKQLEILATQRFSQPPARYSEASLVKKLEELGIGRPSTYAPTISTIQKRAYVVIESREGKNREYEILSLVNGKISNSIKTEKVGFEKSKMFPTDIGSLVNSFLTQYFLNIIDYNFTALVEKEFDDVAEGIKKWNKVIEDFYSPFHKQVADTLKTSRKVSGERLLGIDPASGKNVYVKLGKYGPLVQIGENDDTDKPRFAGLLKGQSMDKINLEEALALFKFPKVIGTYHNAEVVAAVGRFGPYIRYQNAFYALKKTDNIMEISLKRAIELIEEKISSQEKKLIREFTDNTSVKVLNGRYGAYISDSKLNYRIPKGLNPAGLSLEDCLKIIADSGKTEKSSKKTKKQSKK